MPNGEAMNQLRERLTTVETLVGPEPASGLRGEVGELHVKFDRILERLNTLDKRVALIVGGIVLASRVAEILFVK